MSGLRLRLAFRLVALAVTTPMVLETLPRLPALEELQLVANTGVAREVLEALRLILELLAPLSSLALALLSAVLLNPVLYVFSLVLAIGSDVQPSLALIAPVFVLSALNNLESVWRPRFVESIRVRGIPAFLLSFSTLIAAMTALSLALGAFLWRAGSALERASALASEETLAYLLYTIASNPVFKTLLLGALLSLLYVAFFRIAEVVVYFAKPSPRLYASILASLEESRIKPPLGFVKTLAASLLFFPFIAVIANALVTSRLAAISSSPLVQLAISLAVAYLVLALSWVLVARALRLSEDGEPSVASIVAGAAFATALCLGAYLAGYWDPSRGLTGFRYLDSVLLESIDRLALVFKILEAVLRIVGALP
ncbi:MAG: hypothetical protein QXF57_05060 [Acidilobaceae archaeon]